MTIQNGWILFKSATAADTDLVAATTRDGSSPPSGAFVLDTQMVSAMQLIVAGAHTSSVDNQAIPYKLYAGRGDGGPAFLVAAGTITLGQAIMQSNPAGGANPFSNVSDVDLSAFGAYAQTISITTNGWVKSAWVNGDQGADGVASLQFDPYGFKWFWMFLDLPAGVSKAVVYCSYVN